MKKYSASAIAVYLDQGQREVLLKDDSLAPLFFSKLASGWPGLKLYSNADLSAYQPDMIQVTAENEAAFLREVATRLPDSTLDDPDIDEVFFVYTRGIYPLLDLPLSEKMTARHTAYLAQYTYSENLPPGMVPFLVSREFVASLPADPGDAHAFLMKNINHYDVEIFFEKPDLRQMRLDFTLGDTRSLETAGRLLKVNPDPEYKALPETIAANPAILRPAPSWVEVELFRGCGLKCTFCPRQFSEMNDLAMSLETFNALKTGLDSITTPFTVCLGGMGEPLLHPEILPWSREILASSHLSELVIETSLYSNLESFFAGLQEFGEDEMQKLSFIINLTTLQPDKYTKICSGDINIPLQNLERLAGMIPKERIHIQIMRILETDDEIDEFYRHFTEKGYNVLIQKYNRFAGLMPEKRVTDLTPVQRDFCWHLFRDFYINADGNSAICRNDFNHHTGNINNESLADIWEKGLPAAAASIRAQHDSTGAPCSRCDEWYTFNA